MNERTRPLPAEEISLPPAPLRVAIVGAGRVGTSIARALGRSGHQIVAELHRNDELTAIAHANVIVISVADDVLSEVAARVGSLRPSDAVVLHTCGLAGVEPLGSCGPLVAAIHPASPVAARGQSLEGVPFAVTCADSLRDWCGRFVADLGGIAWFIDEDERVRYHAALVMASNFAVTLAGDAAELLGSHQMLGHLLRATVENIIAFGPDRALTGPIVRGDAGTVRAHLRALPAQLRESYVANAKRTLARALASGRLDVRAGQRIQDVLDEVMVR